MSKFVHFFRGKKLQISKIIRNFAALITNPIFYVYMWPIQQYTKFALATAYFPESTYDAAIRRLRRWITGNHDLQAQLAEAGYQQRQHHYTARQVALIFEYLGEP